MVHGLHPVQDVTQVTEELLHPLDDAVQSPAEGSERRVTPGGTHFISPQWPGGRVVGQRPGSPALNLSGAEQSSIPASAELSVPGGRGWERGRPLVPRSEAASPEDREHRGQGPTRGRDAGYRYLLCEVALVTASSSWSFICFSRWSCSSWSLRSSCTDSLQDTGKEPTMGCYKPGLPVMGSGEEACSRAWEPGPRS